MKLGRRYILGLLIATILVIVGVYVLELRQQEWVLAHPILDGAIGGAVIVPASAIVALAVIDRRIEAVTRRSRASQVSRLTERLRLNITQSLKGGILGAIGQPAQKPVLEYDEIIALLQEVSTWERHPSANELDRIDNVVLPYIYRCTEVASDLASLTDDDRLRTFSDFIVDGADWIKLAVVMERATDGSAEQPFYSVYAPILQIIANMAKERCAAALPLVIDR